jgi:BlaI family penicillinase repressor
MKPDITEAEMEVLKALWKSGGGTVREVAEMLPKKKARAYTTIQTLLKRLEDKGAVAVEKGSVPHVYRASVTRQGLMKQRLKSIAEDLCDGAAGPLLLALVDNKKFSEKELKSFKSLIDKLDNKGE